MTEWDPPVSPSTPWPSLWSRIYYTMLPRFAQAMLKGRRPPLGRRPTWKSETSQDVEPQLHIEGTFYAYSSETSGRYEMDFVEAPEQAIALLDRRPVEVCASGTMKRIVELESQAVQLRALLPDGAASKIVELGDALSDSMDIAHEFDRRHELAKARIAELEAERDRLKTRITELKAYMCGFCEPDPTETENF